MWWCLGLVLGVLVGAEDVVIRSAERSVDLTSQLAKVNVKLVVENTGKEPLKSVLIGVEPELAEKVAYVGSGATPSLVKGAAGRFWKVELKESAGPGKTGTVEVDLVLGGVLAPYPTEVTQRERQLVRYTGSAVLYTPYRVLRQTTVFRVPDRSIESVTRVDPTSQSEGSVTYGPYTDSQAFRAEPVTLHFENNSPFLVVRRLERLVEISHWGNVAVEETLDVEHVGARLKGPFSRYEYQREPRSGLSSVKSFKTVLPASARDVYYRDDIGNISTSHLRRLPDSVELDLRPRFPLFGGWKTHYTLGYNLPGYEYLYHSGDRYRLVVRLVDHVFDDMIVEEAVTRIILPEGVSDVVLTPPYSVKRLPDARRATYLDTKGRLVLSVSTSHLVEHHIQDLQVEYTFPRYLMLQEPLLLVAALFLLFLLVVLYVRLDLGIGRDEVGEARLRVAGLVDKVLSRQDTRSSTYRCHDELLARLKTSKDVSAYTSSVKSLNQEYKTATSQVGELVSRLRSDAPELADKVAELQRIDKALKEVYTQKQALYVDKLVPGKIARGPFLDQENTINRKRDEILDRISSLLKSLH